MCDDWGPNQSSKMHTLLKVVALLCKIISTHLIISNYWVADAFWEKSRLETEISNFLGHFDVI